MRVVKLPYVTKKQWTPARYDTTVVARRVPYDINAARLTIDFIYS